MLKGCHPGRGCFTCPFPECRMGQDQRPTREEARMRQCGNVPAQKKKPGKVPSYRKILY